MLSVHTTISQAYAGEKGLDRIHGVRTCRCSQKRNRHQDSEWREESVYLQNTRMRFSRSTLEQREGKQHEQNKVDHLCVKGANRSINRRRAYMYIHLHYFRKAVPSSRSYRHISFCSWLILHIAHAYRPTVVYSV
jgi:hypothetical protein